MSKLVIVENIEDATMLLEGSSMLTELRAQLQDQSNVEFFAEPHQLTIKLDGRALITAHMNQRTQRWSLVYHSHIINKMNEERLPLDVTPVELAHLKSCAMIEFFVQNIRASMVLNDTRAQDAAGEWLAKARQWFELEFNIDPMLRDRHERVKAEAVASIISKIRTQCGL